MRAIALCGLVTRERARASAERALGDAARRLETFECEAVVLDAVMTPELVAGWASQSSDTAAQVAAVHAPCPGPQPTRSDAVYHPTDLRPASGDRPTRDEALALVRPTLDTAALLGAPAVIIEGGPLAMGTAVAALEVAARVQGLDGRGARALSESVRRQRPAAGAVAVDGLSFAVEALLPTVESRGLRLVLGEARGLDWAGSPGELALVLERFAGAPLGWCADPVGRAAGERLLPGWEDEAAPPTLAPEAVWWRLPPEEEAWTASTQTPAALTLAQTEATHILGPEDGTLAAWHFRAWDDWLRSSAESSAAHPA